MQKPLHGWLAGQGKPICERLRGKSHEKFSETFHV